MILAKLIMRYPSKLAIARFIAVILFIGRSEAGKIDSLELLVGDWNTTIRCSSLRFASELFPPRVLQSDERVPQSRIGWERPRTFHCNLSLYPNGTFGLYANQNVVDTAANADDDNSQPLPVRGRWILQPNPYCVTDRFYDQVILHSYPRIKKKVVDGQEEEILQSLRLDIQCRLTGHFSHGRLLPVWGRLPFFARAKLSHGVVVLNQEFSGQLTSKARPRIAATFAATRNIPSNRRGLENSFDDDKIIFGY